MALELPPLTGGAVRTSAADKRPLAGRYEGDKDDGGERQVEPDAVLQGSRAAVGAASQLLLGEHGEPTLDLVDPRGVGGREVKVEAGVSEQPAVDQRRLVGAAWTPSIQAS